MAPTTTAGSGEGEQAWSHDSLRADGPEYLPLRTFRDDDLLDPGSDPLIALMGALSALYEGERVVARLLLRSLGPDWSQAHLDKADPIRIEKAFPAIISKAKSQRVNRLMRSRAPKIAHPRRVGSTYLLSGLVKCHKCNRALSGQDAKSGQFSYYVCQSIMKRGKDACDTPRLNARRFEEMVVGKIRSNILTEGNIRDSGEGRGRGDGRRGTGAAQEAGDHRG